MNLNTQQFLHEIYIMISNELKTNVLSSLKLFVSDAKFKAKVCIDDYINQTYITLVESLELEQQTTFIDFSTGYRAVMHQWLEDHPISIIEEIDDKQCKKSHINTLKYSVFPFSFGTLASVYIGYSCSIPIGIVLEIITAGITYKAYQKGKKKDVEIHEEKLFKVKRAFCEHLKNGLLKWMENAVTYSAKILKEQYNITNHEKQQ